MGADIYLSREWDRRFNEAKQRLDELQVNFSRGDGNFVDPERQAGREEYFKLWNDINEGAYWRDSYGYGNFMGLFDWSYWKNYDELCDENGLVQVEGMKKWLAFLEENGKEKLSEENIRAYIDKSPDSFEDPNDLNVWVQYFRGRYEQLTTLLRRGIETEDPLIYSV